MTSVGVPVVLFDLPAKTGARALVTGATAVGIDISQSLRDVFPLYLLVVVGLAIIIAVFRHRQTVNADDLRLLRW